MISRRQLRCALAHVWAWSFHASFSIMAMSGFEGMVVGRWEDHEGPKSSWMVEESMAEGTKRGVG
jgi:hypothetical protein